MFTVPFCDAILALYTMFLTKHFFVEWTFFLIFVGSHACAANHYVIAEKCGHACPHLRRASIWRTGVDQAFVVAFGKFSR